MERPNTRIRSFFILRRNSQDMSNSHNASVLTAWSLNSPLFSIRNKTSCLSTVMTHDHLLTAVLTVES